ncbi:MAG: hypothetical protein BRD40_00895 [Bacteroidetes bacterium QS_1_65_9]|nr:MAG: hypothetical protein BRD40_00895 [Bacteroidetes bacterium QS_1_65_9]
MRPRNAAVAEAPQPFRLGRFLLEWRFKQVSETTFADRRWTADVQAANVVFRLLGRPAEGMTFGFHRAPRCVSAVC